MANISFDPDLCESSLLEDSAVVDSIDVGGTPQSEIARLRNRISALEQRTAPAPQSIGPPQVDSERKINWGQILSVFSAILAICLFVGGVVWVAHSELTQIYGRMDKTDERIQRMEIALKILADAQGGKTKDLVNDALTISQMYVDSGRTERAQRVLAIANELVAEQPLRSQNQDAAKELLENARNNSAIRIPTPVIEQAGKSFIDAAQKDPGAWNVALDFVSYRSVLNSTYRPKTPTMPLSNVVSSGTHWDYSFNHVAGHPNPTMQYTAGWGVPSKEAARYDYIGADRNTKIKLGPAVLVVSGGATNLDNLQIRNVIFDGVEVHYSRKHLILKNVTFINCTFVIDNSDPGRRLGQEMLASSSVDFKQPA